MSSAEHLKSFDKIPGPIGLPVVGNLLSFGSGKAYLTWTEWAKAYGKIYRCALFIYVCHYIKRLFE